MKRCPECRRDYYDETLMYCLDDGTALVEGPATADQDPVTVRLKTPESHSGSEASTRVYTSGDSISHEIKRHKIGTVAVIGVAVILLSAASYGIYRFLDKPSAPRSTANMQAVRLTGDGKARGAVISPDGKFLAYIRVEGGDRSIWLKQIRTQSNIAIVKPGEFARFDNLAFSPDGEFLYFNAQTDVAQPPTIYRVPTLGGSSTRTITNASVPQLSPDGKQISYGRFDAQTNEIVFYVANTDGTNERKVVARGGTQFFIGGAAWSPDSKMLAVIAGDDALTPNPSVSVLLVPVAGGSPVEVGGTVWMTAEDLAWHPSGDSIIIAATDSVFGPPQLFEISYPSGEIRRLTNNLNGYYSVSMTADGASLVTGEIFSRSAVWVSPDLKPENAKAVMPSSGDTWGLGWTADNRIVYISDQTGDPEVWIMDADGQNAKALTSDRVYKTTPVASPDGRYIVYTSAEAGGSLVRINTDGSNRTVIITSPGADNPDISPDGKWVIFSAYFDGKVRVARVPIDGGSHQVLTSYIASEPRYSRDGTRFACFVVNPESQVLNRLAIVAAEGGDTLQVFDPPLSTNISRGPLWTPDDKGITLVIAPGEKQNLWLQPVDGGPGKQITDVEVPGIARREYSRDGKRIAIVRAEGVGNAVMITGFR